MMLTFLITVLRAYAISAIFTDPFTYMDPSIIPVKSHNPSMIQNGVAFDRFYLIPEKGQILSVPKGTIVSRSNEATKVEVQMMKIMLDSGWPTRKLWISMVRKWMGCQLESEGDVLSVRSWGNANLGHGAMYREIHLRVIVPAATKVVHFQQEDLEYRPFRAGQPAPDLAEEVLVGTSPFLKTSERLQKLELTNKSDKWFPVSPE